MFHEFTTVFEIGPGSNGVRADALFRGAIGVVGLVGGVLQLVRRIRSREENSRGLMGPLILVFWSSAWLILHLPLLRNGTIGLHQMLDSYRAGKCQVTEGVVHVTHRQPATGHSSGDKISIGNQSFEINYFLVTPGYNRTLSHGGVLGDGVYARLHHDHGVIMKVEVETSKTAGP